MARGKLIMSQNTIGLILGINRPELYCIQSRFATVMHSGTCLSSSYAVIKY